MGIATHCLVWLGFVGVVLSPPLCYCQNGQSIAEVDQLWANRLDYTSEGCVGAMFLSTTFDNMRSQLSKLTMCSSGQQKEKKLLVIMTYI